MREWKSSAELTDNTTVVLWPLGREVPIRARSSRGMLQQFPASVIV